MTKPHKIDSNHNIRVMKKKGQMDTKELIMAGLEFIWALLMTAYYIVKDVFDHLSNPPGKSLKDMHVLITGGARGLGQELAVRLGLEGCRLTIVDVADCSETCGLARAAGAASADCRVCDITDRTAVENLVRDLPPVDILVNNAGIVSSAPILDVSDQHIDRMFQVNVMAHFWTIRAVLPSMIQRGQGHIVAIASAAAFTAAANIVPYAATKYAVTGLMASLREEMRLKHPSIITTSVHPFFISPPPSSVAHWDKTSRLPDVTAVEVARRAVAGIKRNKVTVTVPHYLYFLFCLLQWLPSAAGEMWRDIFPARISALNTVKPREEKKLEKTQ